MKAKALHGVLENWKSLQRLWDESLGITNDSEMKARIAGVQHQMTQFSFLYGTYSMHSSNLFHLRYLSQTISCLVERENTNPFKVKVFNNYEHFSLHGVNFCYLLNLRNKLQLASTCNIKFGVVYSFS